MENTLATIESRIMDKAIDQAKRELDDFLHSNEDNPIWRLMRRHMTVIISEDSDDTAKYALGEVLRRSWGTQKIIEDRANAIADKALADFIKKVNSIELK